MKKLDIIRAWKDDGYRQSLSNEQLALLPENPAGEFELSDADLQTIYGGKATDISATGNCNSFMDNNCISTHARDSCKVK